MRKLLAYFLLTMANIILLAHDVIPHHHHHAQVCVSSRHCHPDEFQANHTAQSPEGHQHDGDGRTSECSLKQFTLLPSNHWKTSVTAISFQPGNDGFFVSASVKEGIQDPVFPLSRQWSFKDKNPALSGFSVCSSGLRAPPLV